jgi:hypothetical protein
MVGLPFAIIAQQTAAKPGHGLNKGCSAAPETVPHSDCLAVLTFRRVSSLEVPEICPVRCYELSEAGIALGNMEPT